MRLARLIDDCLHGRGLLRSMIVRAARNRFAILLSLVFLPAVQTLLAAELPDEELLKNPGFNEAVAGKEMPSAWSIAPTAAKWRERAYLSKDYEIVSRPGAYVLASQSVTLKPGQRYTVTLTLKGSDGAMGGVLLLHGPDKPIREMPIAWNIEPTADYERYMASFVAPNPVGRLMVYNVARKGEICYDHVSLREGEPDRPYIAPFTLKPIDRPVGEPVVSRRIDWASSLPGGPIKAFVTIRTFLCSGDVNDLAQRLDLDCDLVHTGYQGDECISETGRRANRRLEAAYYEVYVVPSRVSEILARTIRQRVEAGAGLVVVEGFGQAGKYAGPKEWRSVDDSHYLRSGIPWNLMPEKILQAVETAEIGRGRGVRLRFPLDKSRVWGLLPSENNMAAYQARQFEYWEWWYSLLAKAIVWAAHREGDVRLAAAQATERGITLKVEGAPAGCRASVAWRSGREIRFDGPLLRETPREVALTSDNCLALVAPAGLPAGMTIADVSLLDGQGKTLAWGSFAVETPQRVRVTRIETDRESYAPGDRVTLKLALSATSPAQVALSGRLVDAFGRVLTATERAEQVRQGEQSLSCVLRLRDPLCVHHRAMVRLSVDGREQDSAWCDVFVPPMGPALAAADFTATTWSPGMTHPIRLAQFAARIRELGLNSEFASSMYAISEHGMPIAGYIGPPPGVFRCEKQTKDGVRPQCLSNPAVVEKYTAAAREAAAKQRPFGLFAAGITDEAFLTSRHQRDEVCFSPYCQERYRKWLQKGYGSLDALNAEWGTNYRDWSEIRGARTEDVRGKANFAPFVDFRTFMTDVWVDACKTVTEAYHQAAPHMPIGHTNTFGADPFNGNDYWKLCTQTGFGWGQEYSEAIKAQGQKAIFEIWRSFVETPESRRARSPHGTPAAAAPFFNYGWIGYDHSVPAAHYEPWWLALHGARGLSWYAVNSMDVSRGTSWSLVYPTLRLTSYSQAAREGLHDLRAGCGKLLMEYAREEPQIALLWSYPSMLVSWCESKGDEPEPHERPGADSFVSHYRSALTLRQHIDELQLDCDYVAPEQILTSDSLKRYRLLVLPFTVAMSRPLADRLRQYMENGGVIVGDLRCLRTDEHGKPFEGDSPLEQVFGVRRVPGEVRYGATQVKFKATEAGIDMRGQETQLYGREPIAAVDATALAAHATGEPAVLVRRCGKGFSVYLNFCLPDYDPVMRELVAQLARRAGIDRRVTVAAEAGQTAPRCYERNTFTRGPVAIHAFIRDHRRCKDSDPVRFQFGQTAHVYDVRAGRYLGHVAEARAVVAPGETALYACLPYRVKSLDVSLPADVAAGDSLKVKAAVRGEASVSGDHVFHLELVGPDGKLIDHYARNLLAPRGQLEVSIPLAHNDPAGQWTIRVRDVLSGVASQASAQVRRH